jgi:hypothetical protein
VAVPVYRIVLGDRKSYSEIADITSISFEKKGTYRLNRPAVWSFRVPTDQTEINEIYGDGRPNLCKGRTIRVYRTDTNGNISIVFNGLVVSVSYSGDRNDASALVSAADPSYWWQRRWVTEADGNLGNPNFGTALSGGEILQLTLQYSKDVYGGLMLDTFNGIYTNTADRNMVGVAMTSFPKRISDLAADLTNTGELDIVIDPVDTWEGAGYEPSIAGGPNDQTIIGRLSAVTRYGSDQPSVGFDYATGLHNVSSMTYTDSIETLCNKLWYYLGPRESMAPLRFSGGNIVHDDAGLQLGEFAAAQNIIDAAVVESQSRFGVWHDLQFYDTYRKDFRDLFRVLWQMEVLMRVNGRELVELTPDASSTYKPFEDYYLGDTPRISSGPKLGVTLTNLQARIYGFEVAPDNEGVEQMGPLTLSDDGEGPGSV